MRLAQHPTHQFCPRNMGNTEQENERRSFLSWSWKSSVYGFSPLSLLSYPAFHLSSVPFTLCFCYCCYCCCSRVVSVALTEVMRLRLCPWICTFTPVRATRRGRKRTHAHTIERSIFSCVCSATATAVASRSPFASKTSSSTRGVTSIQRFLSHSFLSVIDYHFCLSIISGGKDIRSRCGTKDTFTLNRSFSPYDAVVPPSLFSL